MNVNKTAIHQIVKKQIIKLLQVTIWAYTMHVIVYKTPTVLKITCQIKKKLPGLCFKCYNWNKKRATYTDNMKLHAKKIF